ncbi:MAG: hypothetical protein KDB00_08520, partial [Planctomycetales bacterium]|nr:hypothetical protein [Planctomycetales bacterium]
MNEEDQNDRNDPELEARVVADVLGEASDLEHNQLSKLIEDNPELAAKKEQFIRVDELLRDVAQGEFDVEDSDWKLPEDRRAAVSAVLQSKLSMQTDTVSPVGTVILGQSIPNVFWSKTRLTAVLVAAVFCGLMVMTSYSYLNTRDRLRVSQSAAELKRSPATVSDWEDFYVDSEAAARNYSAAEKPEFESDYSIVPQQPTDSESDTRFEYSNNSKSALSAIRDRLAVVPQTIEPKRLAEENLGDPRDFGSGSSFSRSTIEDSPTTPLPDLKLSIENATNASDFDVSSSKDQKDGTELSTPSGEFLNRADMVESRRRIQTPNHWDESFELPLGQADKPAEAESQSGSPQEWMKNKSGAIVAGGAQFKREVDTPSSQNMPRFGEQSGQGQVDATLGSSF